jgi:hypothetical protein
MIKRGGGAENPRDLLASIRGATRGRTVLICQYLEKAHTEVERKRRQFPMVFHHRVFSWIRCENYFHCWFHFEATMICF